MSNSSRSRRWARRGIELALIVALIFGLRAWQQRDIVTGLAPELEGVLLDGRAASLAELRGKLVLVHFWAVWCPVCALEEGSIDAIAQDYQVITVAMHSGSDVEVASYLKESGLDFPVLNDPAGVYANRWGVTAVPASFVIDTDGRIRFTEIGYSTGIGLRIRLWLAERAEEKIAEVDAKNTPPGMMPP